jgi:hypothetical protein
VDLTIMASFRHTVIRSAMLLGLLSIFPPGSLGAAPSGHLSALFLDETGRPLSDVFVSLFGRNQDHSFPTLARTNELGRIHVTDLAAGTYQIRVKSSEYRSPAGRLVEILPERTAVVTLILQQIFALGPTEENLGLKALLRNSNDRRLIFRNQPVPVGTFPEFAEGRGFFEEATFQVYTNGGLGGNYYVFPGDSWAGTSTNFAAVVDSLGGREHIVAGQLNSGEDSLWRIKNIVRYQLSDNHSVDLFMGYGRFTFEGPSLALLGDPRTLPAHSEFAALSGTSRLLNVGFEDTLRFGPALTVTWGLEVDQVRTAESAAFVSPSAAVGFSPFDQTSVRLMLASKRNTLANTVTLPDGNAVNLASPVYIAQIGEDFLLGTGRHVMGSIAQGLGQSSEVEFAVFENASFGGAMPLLAVYEFKPGADVLTLPDDRVDSRGCKISFRQSLGDNLKAEISYSQGRAPGLDRVGFEGEFAGLTDLIGRKPFHALATQWQAFVPASGTHVTALVKFAPGHSPLLSIDPLSDVYDTGNEGVNLFVRQLIPLPDHLLRFFGLDFLAPYRLEAMLDIRNLTNEDVGTIQTGSGEVTLLQSPRSIRGGVSFKF